MTVHDMKTCKVEHVKTENEHDGARHEDEHVKTENEHDGARHEDLQGGAREDLADEHDGAHEDGSA